MTDRINFILRRTIRFFGSVRLALGTVLTIGMLLAIAALFFFGWLADEMLEGDMLRFDQAIRNYVHGFAFPFLTSLMELASFLGSTLFLILFGVGIVIALCLRKHRRGAILFTITTVGASVLIIILKLSFRRVRPEPFFGSVPPDAYSFPSGHSLGAFCFYGALAEILSERTNNRPLQIIIWLAAITMILLIGISRIYLGVHHPSDVVAGYAVAFIWVMAIAVGDKLIHARENRRRKSKAVFSPE